MSKIKLSSKTKTPFLYLVSKSPRRYDLLKKAGYQFEALSIEISEIIDENLNPKEQCLALARLKMNHFLSHYDKSELKTSFILTCDTMVEFNGEVLGKPKDRNQAKGWILDYSEKPQWVHTGCSIAFFDSENLEVEVKKDWVSSTKVIFGKVDEGKVDAYLDQQPDFIGKAGGYGLQDEGFKFVKKIEGSYTNVVGLPMEDFARSLEEIIG